LPFSYARAVLVVFKAHDGLRHLRWNLKEMVDASVVSPVGTLRFRPAFVSVNRGATAIQQAGTVRIVVTTEAWNRDDLGCRITFVNLIFGWTFIGWIVALAWACDEEHPLSEFPLLQSCSTQRESFGNRGEFTSA
jgi:hypothetical protein